MAIPIIKSFGFAINGVLFNSYQEAISYAQENGLDEQSIKQLFERNDIEKILYKHNPMPKFPCDRYMEILNKRLLGEKLADIATKEGITESRVLQIIQKATEQLKQYQSSLNNIMELGVHFTLESRVKKEVLEKDRVDFVKKDLFSTRTRNCLMSRGYRYLDEIYGISESELLMIPRMGIKSVKEINIVLDHFYPHNG